MLHEVFQNPDRRGPGIETKTRAMRRLGILFSGGTLFVVAFGCNSLLENEPGRLDRGASAADGRDANASSEEASATEPVSGSGADAREPTAPSGSGEDGATPDAGPACTTGSKACGDLCVSLEDPFFGCAGPTCARCDAPNATATCALGACAVGACVAGFGDCNGLPADGCETNLQTVNDCGACGMKCPLLENVDMACVGGACAGTCLAGFGDCNGKPEDGCEKNLLTDKKNCGACGTRCVIGRCEQGICAWP